MVEYTCASYTEDTSGWGVRCREFRYKGGWSRVECKPKLRRKSTYKGSVLTYREREDCLRKTMGQRVIGSISNVEGGKTKTMMRPNPTRQTESDEAVFLESGFATNSG